VLRESIERKLGHADILANNAGYIARPGNGKRSKANG